jgi:hypothetical protein
MEEFALKKSRRKGGFPSPDEPGNGDSRKCKKRQAGSGSIKEISVCSFAAILRHCVTFGDVTATNLTGAANPCIVESATGT